MKKTLSAALTTALVIGAASTTFAAANPFADVPADHWAYDAVSQLAADGVIEGYGDSTFKGNRNITRYEMAQMVAKAMAKNTNGADKALVDKLAAEFGEELSNLGVRVANLERNADKVKWNGEARYRYWDYRDKQADGKTARTDKATMQFRLLPTAEINENWKVKARFTATSNAKNDTAGKAEMTFVYADGVYDNVEIKVGKMPFFSANDDGLVMDNFFSGAQLTAGKDVKVILQAGRWDIAGQGNSFINAADVKDHAGYQGVQVNYEKDKIFAGVGYRHFNSTVFKTVNYSKSGNDEDAHIWSVGGKYTFNKIWALGGAYAQNTKADSYNKSASVQLDYKKANKVNAGSWGAFLGYRHVGANVSLAPTFDTTRAAANVKGWDLGATYIPFKNTLVTLGYFNGKQLNNDRKTQTMYARLSYFF